MAANPTAVARNAAAKADAAERLAADTASAASGSPRLTTVVTSDRNSHCGRARTMSRGHAEQVDVVEEQRDETDRERDDDDRPEVRPHHDLSALL